MIYPVWMIPQLWTLITNNFFFQSLTAASYHSARRACPELQNPLLQKAKENLLPGEKGLSQDGWGLVKRGSSPNLNQRLRRTPLSRRTRVIPGIMDSATSPSALRRMTALVEISENQMKTKGGFSPVLEDQTLITWRYLAVHLSHTRDLGNIIAHFLSSFFFCTELLELLMEEISIH